MSAKPGLANTSRSVAFTTATPSTMLPRIAADRLRSSVERANGAIHPRSGLIQRSAQLFQCISRTAAVAGEIAFGNTPRKFL